MPMHINWKEGTSAARPDCVVNADAWKQCRRWSRFLFGKAALTLALPACLAVGGVRHAYAQTYSVLFSFNGANGGGPNAGLITDSSGNLYGTTAGGGLWGAGTVFKLDPSGNQTVLHSFSGGDGAGPNSRLVRDSSGNLYGTTVEGGSWGYGTLFKLDPSGNETVLHSFGFEGDEYPYGVVMDSSGNLYGTTTLGGAANSGTVFKVDPSGNETVLHSFWSYAGDGAFPQAALIMDSSGNLYGTTVYGGCCGSGTVFKLDPPGNETVLHSFGGLDGLYPQAALIMDASGNLYGTTYGSPHWGGTVFKLDPSGNVTVLHQFSGGYAGLGGQYPVAGVVMDASGNLYGTTQYGGFFDPTNAFLGAGIVFKLDPSGNETELHEFGLDSADGAYPQADLIMDASGNLYGTTQGGGSSGLGTVFKLTFSVPFSEFRVKLDITSERRPGFRLKAHFTQGTGAAAIDPLSQPLTLSVGTYMVTIPAGSFHEFWKGAYAFEGDIAGTALRVAIVQTGADSYLVHVDAACIDLAALTNPVPVNLSIGQNTGTTQVTADFRERDRDAGFEFSCGEHRGPITEGVG
jgi:uncharacterized repeat protein (TIGR03803 family)